MVKGRTQNAFVDIVSPHEKHKNKMLKSLSELWQRKQAISLELQQWQRHMYMHMHIGVGLGNAIATPLPGSGLALICSTFQLAPLANTLAHSHPQKVA